MDSQVIRDQLIDWGCVEALATLNQKARIVLPQEKFKEIMQMCRNLVLVDQHPPFEKVKSLMFIFTEHYIASITSESIYVDLALECLYALRKFAEEYE